MAALRPQYQLAVTASGTWRARVFNLPPHRPDAAPTLPFLVALSAQAGNWRSGWHNDPEGALTVLRLAGGQRATLAPLLALFAAHGIEPAGTAATERRARPPKRAA